MKSRSVTRSRGAKARVSDTTSQPDVLVQPELRLKKILVPIDFSETSRKAVQYAVSFAKQFKAELHLLHIVEPTPAPPEVVYLESAAIYTEAREVAEKQLAEWRTAAAAETITKATVRNGIAHREIVRAASELKADLIIVGTHGRTGLTHLFMGSTAERVIREATCPVLVVRAHERDFLSRSRRGDEAEICEETRATRATRRRTG